jgi:hypothetical protein
MPDFCRRLPRLLALVSVHDLAGHRECAYLGCDSADAMDTAVMKKNAFIVNFFDPNMTFAQFGKGTK